jgi:hypothetical protein
MVWWFTSTRHELAINWARVWLRASLLDRLLYTLILGMPWWWFWGVVGAATGSYGVMLLFGMLPWLFWALDTVIDYFHTNGDIKNLMSGDDVVLATRTDYVGGHPQLPHGRFAYLTLRGDRENPKLTLGFPRPDGQEDTFDIPLLDIGELRPETSREESLAQAVIEPMLAELKYRPGRLFSGERVTLNVGYQGPGGRKHVVELSSFFRGNDEIHNWRNYLICAQAEADTGIKPFGPWKSLKSAPQEETSDDDAGDGSRVQPSRRAFERR